MSGDGEILILIYYIINIGSYFHLSMIKPNVKHGRAGSWNLLRAHVTFKCDPNAENKICYCIAGDCIILYICD